MTEPVLNAQDLPVTVAFMPKAQAASIVDLSKLPDDASDTILVIIRRIQQIFPLLAKKTMKRIALIAIAAIMVAACGQPSSKIEVSVNPSEYTSKNQDNMQRVRDFLHEAGVYFLATVDGDTPQVRPFGTAEIIEGKLYIQTGHVKNVAKQIAANPKVAICAYKADEGRWLRISATLVEDPRVEVKKAMLDANPGLRSMYDENDGNTAVYFLKDAKATISSFTAEPVEIDF